MNYPRPLKKGDTIGICAPSSGVTGIFSKKLDYAKKKLQELGYDFKESNSVRNQEKLASASSKIRAKEFMSLYLDNEVKAIIPPWGGEILMDMLPYLNFEKLKKSPSKWILGFSDISTLLFSMTIKTDIATAHGPNLLDFGNDNIDSSVLNVLDILNSSTGDEFEQKSLSKYQDEWLEISDNYFPPYDLTEKVKWKLLNIDKVSFKGRLLGGNLDVISALIGTSFDLVKKYINRYKDDKIIWYFESCEMSSADIYRTLWQMKYNGWFKNCSGFMYGRLEGYKKVQDFTIEDAFKKIFDDLNIPVVYDVDIGHKPPQLTFINGAFCEVKVKEQKGKVIQKLI